MVDEEEDEDDDDEWLVMDHHEWKTRADETRTWVLGDIDLTLTKSRTGPFGCASWRPRALAPLLHRDRRVRRCGVECDRSASAPRSDARASASAPRVMAIRVRQADVAR